MYSSFFIECRNENDSYKQNKNFIKHLFLSKLLFLKKKFEVVSSDIIICIDSSSWRKKIFPHYKAARKKHREESEVDYELLFKTVDEFYTELKDTFPFFVLKHEQLEADDWIAIVARLYEERKEDVMIVSTDKDFHQLHTSKIRQFDHIKSVIIKTADTQLEKIIKILNGDPGDGIPNIFSDDDTFVTEGKRQKPLGEKKALKLIQEAIEQKKTLDDLIAEKGYAANYTRNRRLIDLDLIPVQVKDKALEVFLSTIPKKFNPLFLASYFDSNKLRIMADRIEEFK